MDTAAFTPKPSTLYAVATPIGNLRDITLRALDVLRGVDCVFAEDTRVSGVLLAHFGISVQTIALHAHNEKRQSDRVIERLMKGHSVAFISDAGTPGLSDPGAELVAEVRSAGFAIEPIPGASSLTAALSVTGWHATPFTFHGFLPPRPAARRTALESLVGMSPANVFFEAPHRIDETLGDLAKVLGPARRITIARELTKRFETIHETTLGQALAWVSANPDRRRGEFVLIVEGAAPAPPAGETAPSSEDMRVFNLLRKEMSAPRAAKLAADITKKSRDAFYRRSIEATADASDAEPPVPTA